MHQTVEMLASLVAANHFLDKATSFEKAKGKASQRKAETAAKISQAYSVKALAHAAVADLEHREII